MLRAFDGKQVSEEQRDANLSEGNVLTRSRAPVATGDGNGGDWHALRRHVYCTLSLPEYSTLARYTAKFIFAVIILSCITFCLETLPEFRSDVIQRRFLYIEYFCVAVFTAEFVVRLATAPHPLRFLVTPFTIVDIVAILPFYIEVIVQAAAPGAGGNGSAMRIVRLLRLIRLLRIFKAGQRMTYVMLAIQSLVNSVDLLLLFAVMFLLMDVLFAAIIYFVESGANPAIGSIPTAMYFVATTMTTVGYGDISPVTPAGKWITSLFMLLGIINIALPVAGLGANFGTLYNDWKLKQRNAERKDALKTMRTLAKAAMRHHAALDELNTRAKQLEARVAADVAQLQEDAPRARLLALEVAATAAAKAAAGSAPGGGAALDANGGGAKQEQVQGAAAQVELTALRERIAATMADARQHLLLLEAVLDVASHARSKDLEGELQRSAELTRHLETWVRSHSIVLGEMDDVREMMVELRERLEPQAAAAAMEAGMEAGSGAPQEQVAASDVKIAADSSRAI